MQEFSYSPIIVIKALKNKDKYGKRIGYEWWGRKSRGYPIEGGDQLGRCRSDFKILHSPS